MSQVSSELRFFKNAHPHCPLAHVHGSSAGSAQNRERPRSSVLSRWLLDAELLKDVRGLGKMPTFA